MKNMVTATYPTAQIELTYEDASVLTYVRTLLKQMRGVVKVSMKKPKTTAKESDITKTAAYREAMEDVAAGRVFHAKDTKEMFQQILG